MNKKIKIIELLNKIANEEEMPKKLKFDNTIWIYNPDRYDYIDTGDDIKLFAELVVFSKGWLNQEVEILEDNTEEIEELEKEQEAIANPKTMMQEIRFYYDSNKMGDKINEIIRYIKRKEKNND